jgi:hypothetical protein
MRKVRGYMVSEKQARIKGHSLILIDILKNEEVTKFAEIGVWKSGTCKRILKNTPVIDEYWAIDSWEIELACSRTEKRRTTEKWFQMHRYCCELMMHFPQLKVVKLTSELASTIFPDAYFDMIYIDANHSFENVYADIGYWLPKVREGGIISGHDYGGRKRGVKRAVDMWFGEENINFWEHDEVWIKRV